MEAISCSIPVIATSVGGIPEIVEHLENGFLLSESPNLGEICKILDEAYKLKIINSEMYIKMRKKARHIYELKFDAERNHIKFCNFLIDVYKGGKLKYDEIEK